MNIVGFLLELGGEYFVIRCSCGLFGVGKTRSEAMEHVNDLHERQTATLLFLDIDTVFAQVDCFELDDAA